MSIQEVINQDYLTAYKAREEERVSLLRLLKSAIKNAAIAKKADLSDEEVIRIIKREIGQRQESAGEFERGGRAELAQKERAEIEILKRYLPGEMSQEEIEKIIDETIAALDTETKKQTGRVIGLVIAKAAGRADGAAVAKLVRTKLENQ